MPYPLSIRWRERRVGTSAPFRRRTCAEINRRRVSACKEFVGLALALVLASPLAALDPQRDPSAYNIAAWKSDAGMPSNSSRGVVESLDGYLWVATAQGVARFDGQRFEPFDSSTRTDIKTASFYGAIRAADGTLWFASNAGLYRYRYDHFVHYDQTDGLASNLVRFLAFRRDGTLVVGTSNGLHLVRDGKVSTPPEFKAIVADVRGYLDRADGSQWVVTATGIWRIVGGKTEKLSEPWPGGSYFVWSKARMAACGRDRPAACSGCIPMGTSKPSIQVTA